MAIKLVPDVAVPAGVFVADWATSFYDERATGMKLNRPVGIALAVLGYAGAMLGWGGDAVKNIGVASFDWAANSVVGYIKERGGVAARATDRLERIPIRRHLSENRPLERSYKPEMEKVVAF